MSDTVLDYLREQFARVHGRLDAMHRTLTEHGHRLRAIEVGLARVRHDVAGDAEIAALAAARVDGIEERVARIERRLDLVEDQ